MINKGGILELSMEIHNERAKDIIALCVLMILPELIPKLFSDVFRAVTGCEESVVSH